jgi:hypothetical protein
LGFSAEDQAKLFELGRKGDAMSKGEREQFSDLLGPLYSRLQDMMGSDIFSTRQLGFMFQEKVQPFLEIAKLSSRALDKGREFTKGEEALQAAVHQPEWVSGLFTKIDQAKGALTTSIGLVAAAVATGFAGLLLKGKVGGLFGGGLKGPKGGGLLGETIIKKGIQVGKGGVMSQLVRVLSSLAPIVGLLGKFVAIAGATYGVYKATSAILDATGVRNWINDGISWFDGSRDAAKNALAPTPFGTEVTKSRKTVGELQADQVSKEKREKEKEKEEKDKTLTLTNQVYETISGFNKMDTNLKGIWDEIVTTNELLRSLGGKSKPFRRAVNN